MFRIGVAEDDPNFRQVILEYIERYQKEKGVVMQTEFFQNGSELVFKYESIYDVLLLDIEMPIMNGMDAAREIRKKDLRVQIIFITNMAQYAINGYEVGALDFVLKPIKYFSFSMKMDKALKSAKGRETVSLLLEHKDGIKKVASDEIVYAEIRDHWLHVFTIKGEYQTLSTMKEFVSKMSEYHFICCSKSFCINMRYVTDLQKDIVTLDNRFEVKISRSKKAEVKQALLDYYKGGLR